MKNLFTYLWALPAVIHPEDGRSQSNSVSSDSKSSDGMSNILQRVTFSNETPVTQDEGFEIGVPQVGLSSRRPLPPKHHNVPTVKSSHHYFVKYSQSERDESSS